jgi:TetR/AcrR family transcriptional regulator
MPARRPTDPAAPRPTDPTARAPRRRPAPGTAPPGRGRVLAGPPPAGAGGAARSPASRRGSTSRERLVAAAAVEFATRGYDAARVDRIARAARLTKAMVYYHFAGKAALYRAIVHELLSAVLERVRAVAESAQPPEEKLVAFVRTLVTEAQVRPHFAPLFLREVAEGGRHLDRATLDLLRRVPETLGAIVAEGVARGAFRARHPLLLHFGIVGPLALYVASTPLRDRLRRAGLTPLAAIAFDEFRQHLEEAALAALAARGDSRPGAPPPAAAPRRPSDSTSSEGGSRAARPDLRR